MKKNNFAAIILSAGYSSRMKEFKPLLKFGHYTAVETAVNTFISSEIHNIVVVVGYRGNEIIKVLENSKAKCIENKYYSQGMYSSILKAIEVLDENINGFFMLPVDVPLVKKHTIEILKSKYLQCNKGIIYPTFNGQRGHPPLIDCKYKNIIMNWNEAGGLRNLLNKFQNDSIDVPVFDNSSVMDMDTKKDYLELLKYFNSGVPNREECYCILNLYNVPDNVIKHCTKVSQVSLYILKELNKKGYNFNEKLLESAALLHDIARKSKDHAKVGGEIITKLGYEPVGNLISTHMDIKVEEKEDITEDEILYLSDKLVREDEFITLEQRFSDSLLKYNINSEVLNKIKERFDEARKIMRKVQNIMGKSFDYE